MKTQVPSMTLSDKSVAIIVASVAAINKELSLIATTLTPSEKRTLPKITSGTAYFVEDSLSSAEQNPNFVPPFVDVKGMEISLALFKQLQGILTPVQQVTDTMESTALSAGSEAYMAALSYYNTVKLAAKNGVPGAQAVYEKLKGRFVQSGATVPVMPATLETRAATE
jgi:hypothetical protein